MMTPYDQGYEDGYKDRMEDIAHTKTARGMLHSMAPYEWSVHDEGDYQLGYAHGSAAARKEKERTR